jgi:hypothetical protein
MKQQTVKQTLALMTLAAGTIFGGCIYRREMVPAAAPTTVIVAPAASERAVPSPEGRYELRGDGTTQSPYVWVWIPTR